MAPALTGFALGFAGSLHCVAMCGTILAVGLTGKNDGAYGTGQVMLASVLSRFLALSVGRILSYSLAGGIVGGIGWGLLQGMQIDNGHWILRILTAMLLGTIGSLQLGLVPSSWLVSVSRIFMPISAALNNFFGNLPSGGVLGSGLLGRLVAGLAWGWLPCGLVYGGLTHAMLAGSFAGGFVSMTGFGLGTVPALLALAFAAGLSGQRLRQGLTRPLVRRGAGLVLILIAALSVLEHPANPFCQPL